MLNLSRRNLLRKGGLAATATALGAASLETGSAESGTEGAVFHVFAFRWKPGTTDEQKERATRDIKAFQGVIPGLLETHVGENLSPRGAGYTYGGVMRFKSKAALEAYTQHPAHKALLVWLVPLIEPIELDIYA